MSKFIKGNKLQDDAIVKALRQTADDYENGELSEVVDTLTDIIEAVKTWEQKCEEHGECL